MKSDLLMFVAVQLFCVNLIAAQSAKLCSRENLQILVSKSALFIGEIGSEQVGIRKLFFAPDYSKSNLVELKEQFLRIKNESSAKTGKVAEEIQSFIAKHPECDKDHLFTVKE